MATYNDKTIMKFGKYKGQPLANVPDQYLLWWWKEAGCKHRNWPLSRYIVASFDRKLLNI